MNRLRSTLLTIVLGAGMLPGIGALASPAHAQSTEGGAAAAESLFQEARKLMDAKRYSEACPKLAASQKIAPAVGTLLNLADCYERGGQLASAWARFHEAIALAQRLGRPDREKTAKDRADKLEPRLIRLTIASQEPGLEVKLDGNVLDPAALGTPVPVDPGKHSIEATAKGKKPFTASIDVSDRSRTPSVDIPALETDPEASKSGSGGGGGKETLPPDAAATGSGQRIAGLVVIGAGVVGLGVGTVFGLRTSSKWSDAQDNHCTGIECDRTGVQLAAEAKNAGTVSTIAFIAGGALLAGGAALYFTAPRTAPGGSGGSGGRASGTSTSGPRDVRVGVGLGSLILKGSF